jgi:pimeloyl-ACP methyl ester carboxylesterase
MQSIAFQGCAGWFYDARSTRGVVICAPLGLEELCGRRTLHLLAQRLAAAGLPTLRFDYRGEGDSTGDALDPDCLERWRQDARGAIAELRRLTGVEDIALVGMRFGALLAAEIAAEREDVSHLALIAPVGSGKAYIREARILARLIQTDGVPHETEMNSDFGLAGFILSDETSAAIGAMSADALQRRPAAEIMLVEEAGNRAAAKIAAHFEKLGAGVSRIEFPNYDLMMRDPALSVPADDILAPIADWLASGAQSGEGCDRETPTKVLSEGGWVEEGVVFGAQGLAGFYCRPAERAARHNVVFAGPGNNHHVGWGRSHVEFARALAAYGVASLRIDYAGVGDSGGEQTDIYADERTTDVEAAIAWLAERSPPDGDLSIIGVCSGAYHALRLAVRDPRIKRAVLLNQQRYEVGLHHKLAWFAFSLQARIVFAMEAPDAPGWKVALLRAALGGLYVLRRTGSLLNRARRRLLSAGEQAGVAAETNGAEQSFRALSQRHARVLLVHSPTDPAVPELERLMGPEGRRATALPGVTRVVLDGADHLLSSRAARKTYEAALIGFLA